MQWGDLPGLKVLRVEGRRAGGVEGVGQLAQAQEVVEQRAVAGDVEVSGEDQRANG